MAKLKLFGGTTRGSDQVEKVVVCFLFKLTCPLDLSQDLPQSFPQSNAPDNMESTGDTPYYLVAYADCD